MKKNKVCFAAGTLFFSTQLSAQENLVSVGFEAGAVLYMA